MTIYDIIYILGNLFMAYVIYKYVYIFYLEKKVSRTLEILAYISYFFIITSVHIFFKLPLIVMIVNLVVLFLLTLMYEGSVRKSIIVVVVIYFSLMIIETLFAFLTSYLALDLLQPFIYESEFGIIVIKIASFVLVLLIQGTKKTKNDVSMPTAYWISLLIIPSSTILLLFSIFMESDVPPSLMIISIACALAINLLTFYLYDKISILLENQMKQRIAEAQNRFYEQQVQIMKTTLDGMRVLRHDLKNKIAPLVGLAQAEQSEKLLIQLSELTSIYSMNNDYACSGNITIDSIINYKLNQTEGSDIIFSSDIFVPLEFNLPSFDIAVILGNLLDNALEAVMNVDDRWIDLKIKFTKGRLIIEVNNSFDGKVTKTATGFVSQKSDKENHGFGMKSVQAVLDKYDGAMQFSHDSKKFGVMALLYV